MDIDKMANVIVSGCNGFYFGHWNLSKGARRRKAKVDGAKRKKDGGNDKQKHRD